MKKLLLVAAIVAVCSGCKPIIRPICPENYARQVNFVKTQWHAGHVTTSTAMARLDALDAQVDAWADDHYISDAQKALVTEARK